MGSSKGASQGTQHYSGTIPCMMGVGPAYALDSILLNGEQAVAGPMYRASTTNPVTISTKYGVIHWYWGTEDQPASPLLNRYAEHPPYKGLVYFVFADFDHGQSPNAYNVEVIWRRCPQQSIITGASAAEGLDGGKTANCIVCCCEILTSPYWRGLPASALVASSFQAVADDVQSEIPDGAPAGRSVGAASPLWDQAVDTRSALVSLAAQVDAWLRVNTAGKIECGRWRRDSAPPSVATLTHDDWSQYPTDDRSDETERPNSYAVEFTDSEALHKGAKIPVNDLARIVGRPLVRNTLKADHLITYDQAVRAGQDALRRSWDAGSVSGEVRYGKARTPEGTRLQPGDYLRIPVTQPGEAVEITQLVRVRKVVWPRNATDGVQIDGDIDLGSAPIMSAVQVVTDESIGTGLVMPPLFFHRVLSLPVGATEDPAIYVLAARPANLATGIDVYYDDTDAGDFPLVGKQPGFALPLGLPADVGAAATTVRVRLREIFSADSWGVPPAGLIGGLLNAIFGGINPRRDEHLLRDWSGGATEGRNDELLLILVRLAASDSDVIAANGDRDWVEVLSVAGPPSLVATDTFDVPVLRGRLDTTALAFPAAVTEAWLIPGAKLTAIRHGDFDGMITSGAPGCFRLGAYSGRVTYAPATAYAERQRIAADGDTEAAAEFGWQADDETWRPEVTYSIPRGYRATQVILDGGEI